MATILTYHFNAVGSTIAMTDASQTVVNKYAYDPFGNILSQNETVQPNQPFKYVGQFGVMTEPNGFYYMRARYYDPQVGRFISEDPIGFNGGDVNLMAYVGNNPVNAVDPTGKALFYTHFYDGFRIGYSMGNGFFRGLWKGLQLGWYAMKPDLNELANVPVYHATTPNLNGSADTARTGSLNRAGELWKSGDTEKMGAAVHIWRDVDSHNGSYFPDPASAGDYAKHIWNYDLNPGGSVSSIMSQMNGAQGGFCGK